MGGTLREEDWGEKITKFEGNQLPLVLHFRPQTMVRVKKEKMREFRELMRKNLGVVFDDPDGGEPGPPGGSISGSGDGWDDSDK